MKVPKDKEKRKALIRALANKICDRNDEAMKRLAKE